MTTVAGYIRVSTEEQAREGYGLAAQKEAIRSYCAEQGWHLLEVYSDAGRSGTSLRGREALARLLEDAERGHFRWVVLWKLDRLARNLRDLLEICDRLEAVSVGTVSIQGGVETGTAAGRMYRNVLGSVAEFERELIVERIKAGLAEKARQGQLLGPLPLGYIRDESGAVVPDPTVAPLIREAFARYATGRYSLREMVPWAKNVGLRSTKGNPIDRLSIRKILTNVTYTGQVAYHLRRGGGVIGRGKHPAIVDGALFAEVQQMLARRRNPRPSRPHGREPYPLTGVALCGACGSPMLGCGVTVKKRWRYRYMRCSVAQRQGRHACVQPMVRAEPLEAQLAAYVGGMRLPAEYLGEVVAELRRRRAHAPSDDEVDSLKRQLERWKRLYVLGEIDEKRYRGEAAPLRRRLAELERPREILDVERAVAYLRDVGKLWAESPRPLQREFVREVIQRIVVEGPEIVAITPTPMYTPLFVMDRRERFGGDFCRLAPRAGFEPTT